MGYKVDSSHTLGTVLDERTQHRKAPTMSPTTTLALVAAGLGLFATSAALAVLVTAAYAPPTIYDTPDTSSAPKEYTAATTDCDRRVGRDICSTEWDTTFGPAH